MSVRRIELTDVSGGISPLENEYPKGTFQMSMGIDPDNQSKSSLNSPRASGIIKPVGYTKFSSTGLSGYPMWITTNRVNEKVYAYASDGELLSYSSALTAASETVEGSPTGGAGNGMVAYEDYLWLATPTEITRFDPTGPTFANTWWNGTSGLTLLTNSAYPTFRGVTMPNHAMHLHGDNAVYFCDFAGGQGIINKLKVDSSGNNSGSVYNALDLPFGFYPTDIESWGTDLVVAACQFSTSVTNPVINQGNAAIFFWDTFNDTFYNRVDMNDPYVTALKNVNGRLYAFSGNADSGCSLSQYAGGETFEQVSYFEEMTAPFAGAVDSYGDRLVWGGYVTYPTEDAVAFAYGSKDGRVKMGTHCIIRATTSGSTPIMTAVKQAQHSDGKTPRMLIGWGTGSAKGIEKYSSSASLFSRFRTEKWTFGARFSVLWLRITLEDPVTSAVSITPIAYVDDGASSVNLTAVTNTNYSGKKVIVYKRPGTAIKGKHDFLLDFEFLGTSNVGIVKIEGEVEVFDEVATA